MEVLENGKDNFRVADYTSGPHASLMPGTKREGEKGRKKSCEVLKFFKGRG